MYKIPDLAMPVIDMSIAGEGRVALKSLILNRSDKMVASQGKDTLYPLHCEGDIEVHNVSK